MPKKSKALLDFWSLAINHALESREKVNLKIIDVDFNKLVKDPSNQLERIYRELQFSLDHETRQRFIQFEAQWKKQGQLVSILID